MSSPRRAAKRSRKMTLELEELVDQLLDAKMQAETRISDLELQLHAANAAIVEKDKLIGFLTDKLKKADKRRPEDLFRRERNHFSKFAKFADVLLRSEQNIKIVDQVNIGNDEHGRSGHGSSTSLEEETRRSTSTSSTHNKRSRFQEILMPEEPFSAKLNVKISAFKASYGPNKELSAHLDTFTHNSQVKLRLFIRKVLHDMELVAANFIVIVNRAELNLKKVSKSLKKISRNAGLGFVRSFEDFSQNMTKAITSIQQNVALLGDKLDDHESRAFYAAIHKMLTVLVQAKSRAPPLIAIT